MKRQDIAAVNIEKWAAVLWKYVDEHLVVSCPFFLCLDGLELQRIARRLQVDFDSASAAEADFLLSCLTRVRAFSGRAQLDQSVFERLANGRSLAICFAVQQILAAERMIGDDDASSDAYYARYRQILGLDPTGIGSPLAYDQFQQIWDTLESEMLSLPDAGSHTITFQNGRGKNKYRALPMSQALLDREALRVIHDNVSNIENRSDDDLLHQIRRVSGYLSKRSREKVYVNDIRVGLLSQVRSFVPNVVQPTHYIAPEKGSFVAAGEFFVYIEDDGWDDVYRLGVRSAGGKSKEDVDLTSTLRSYFQQHTVLPFIEGSVSDFEGVSGSTDVLSDAELIVVPESLSILRAVQLAQYFKEPEFSVVPNGYRMLLRDFSVPWVTDVSPTESVEAPRSLSLVGGIVVDRLRQIYLAGFTPTAVRIGKDQLANSELITVNGQVMTIGQFLQVLNKAANIRDFRISVDTHAACLGVASVRDCCGDGIGYQIRGGFCNATTEITGEANCTQYLQVSDQVAVAAAFARRMSKGELIKHLSIPSDSWVPVRAEIVDMIIGVISRELVGSQHCDLLVTEISRRMELPVTLIKVISEVRQEVA